MKDILLEKMEVQRSNLQKDLDFVSRSIDSYLDMRNRYNPFEVEVKIPNEKLTNSTYEIKIGNKIPKGYVRIWKKNGTSYLRKKRRHMITFTKLLKPKRGRPPKIKK